ncbi:4Fe-4S dicluster domain-containing protein [Cyanobacterium sp. uoEpiScrs1]|uniref:4Fe-4S dicluster domain-containing protein n=1 Tax=Cyanobacterium sp. uoEpiScrs1 TaxID=2976343 RepID=UPI00226A8141|nr:4Fe-4S dicluster domain-containing protein [Cyanobacterium sp. uoEpiScrs1]
MSYTITSECIACDRCRVGCPTNAISFDNGVLLIDSTACNHCHGYYGTPQCAAVCPTNTGCLPSESYGFVASNRSQTDYADYWESWFNRYHTLLKRLKTRQSQLYWKGWFDAYSKEMVSLLSQSTIRI